MPIIEPHDPDSPLSQGDLLRDVSLFLTSTTGTVHGGEAAQVNFKHCLVISRPCVAANKPTLVVAGVDKYKSSAPSEVTFGMAKLFLDKLRDGDGSPDQLYLGQLMGDGEQGRFAARLDSLHTLRLPNKPEQRVEFTKKHRFARLCQEFCRDLHTRIFQAFSVLGFDDFGWYSLADLKYLVQTGNSEISRAENEIALLRIAEEAEGSKERQIADVQRRIAEIMRQMSDYVSELNLREKKQTS